MGVDIGIARSSRARPLGRYGQFVVFVGSTCSMGLRKPGYQRNRIDARNGNPSMLQLQRQRGRAMRRTSSNDFVIPKYGLCNLIGTRGGTAVAST